MSRKFWRHVARRAARAYIAGPRLEDALRVCRGLATGGYESGVGYWDAGSDTGVQVLSEYLGALHSLAATGRGPHIAVKAPALGMDFALLSELAAAARETGATLHFDSLGPEMATPIFRHVESLLGTTTNLGITLPGRWRRSRVDAEFAIRLGLRVRVVKGQWADEVQPERDWSDGFLAVVASLAGKARHVAVATHDISLARASLNRLKDAGTSCELELLWGLPHADAVRMAVEMQVPVRFYVPYGQAWLPYAVSQLRSNPRVLLWITRDLFRQGSPVQVAAGGVRTVPG